MLEVLEIIKKYVEENKIVIRKINLSLLLNQDEKIYEDIISSVDINNRISLIYLYSSEKLNSNGNENYNGIIEIFKNNKLSTHQATYGCDVATNERVLAKENCKEIISLITTAKEEYQALYGSLAATNKDILAKEDCEEIINLITNAVGSYQAKYG